MLLPKSRGMLSTDQLGYFMLWGYRLRYLYHFQDSHLEILKSQLVSFSANHSGLMLALAEATW